MKTYALLIGLNKYKEPKIPTLDGCINDINLFETYLKESLHVPKDHILKLTDTQAVKTAIVSAFETHFDNVKKDDVSILYFSGHGVRQHANIVFKTESINDKIECITCYDTQLNGTNLIADKELRWLIHQLTEKSGGCHILTIFDCCHSGDNTRGFGESTLKERFIRIADGESRGREYIMPVRTWRDFIFSKSISEVDVSNTMAEGMSLDVILPQGRHIQLAACASNETAKESGGRGFFSKYLLELLENSKGKITYYDLRSLIYRRLSNFPPENRQTPQFYAFDSYINQPFLGGSPQDTIEATISFNDERKRWEMNMGSVYGIYEGATVFVTLPHKNNEVEAAIVGDVYPDFSVLHFDIESFESKKNIPYVEKRIRQGDNYKANVGKFIQKEIKIACVVESLQTAWGEFCKNRATLLENAYIIEVKSSTEADYVLNTEGEQIFIAQPNHPTRPLVKMFPNAGSQKSLEKIVEQLTAVSRWEFVKAQKSETEDLKLLDNLSINFTYLGQREQLDKMDKKTCVITTVKERKDLDLYVCDNTLSIEIVNNHPTDSLYIAGIWLSELFGIDCTILTAKSSGVAIEPNKSVYVIGKTFTLNFSPHIRIDKWSKFSNYLKVYVATVPFEITQFQQLDLEGPRKQMRGDSPMNSKGISNNKEEAKPVPKWAVKTVEFEIDVSPLR